MAALVHPSSAESTTSQLDLFSVPPSQTSLEKGSFAEYHPVSVLTSTGPIEFTISAENSNYINLSKNGQVNQQASADRPVSSLLGLVRTLQLVVDPS